MGGLISTFIAAEDSSKVKYSGICVAAPYFALFDKEMLKKLKPMVEVLNKVSPNKAIPMPVTKRAHLQAWHSDELFLGG